MRFGRTRRVYSGEKEADQWCCYFFLVIFALALPVGVYHLEWDWKERNLAYEEVRPMVQPVSDWDVNPSYLNYPVVFTTRNIQPEQELADREFQILAPEGTLQLRRVTEYCQWQEIVTHKKDDEGNEYKSYTYIKGWHRHLIPSIYLINLSPITIQ